MEPSIAQAALTMRPSSWATPASHEAGGTPERFLERKEQARENGSKLGISLTSLSLQAQMTTPSTALSEMKSRWYEEQLVLPVSGLEIEFVSTEIQAGADLSGDSGPTTSSGSTVGRSRVTKTGAGGRLNAALSCWLMGIPEAWLVHAPPSSRR
jgi:hypothetical protein